LEYLSIIWEWLDQQFKPVIVLSASIFTVFFALKKIGNKVNVTYTVTSGGSSHTRINNIVFQNKKDKPLSIYKIVAVFDKNYYLEIHKCSPPLILKPYESMNVETEEFSHLSLGEDRYFPEFLDAEIYIESDDKIIKCKAKPHKTLAFNYTEISKITKKFNNIVYNDYVTYILVYAVKNVDKTAFLYDSGGIKHEWDFHYNAIKPSGEKLEADDIFQFLQNNYSQIINSYLLYKINDQTLRFDLLKFHKFDHD